MGSGWSCTHLARIYTCRRGHVHISRFFVHDGSGGQIRTDDLLVMSQSRYSFSTPQWVVGAVGATPQLPCATFSHGQAAKVF